MVLPSHPQFHKRSLIVAAVDFSNESIESTGFYSLDHKEAE